MQIDDRSGSRRPHLPSTLREEILDILFSAGLRPPRRIETALERFIFGHGAPR